MKKLTVILILVLVVVAAAFMAANTWPSTLRVINKSEQPVVLNLGYPYSYLYVASGGDITYTIEKDEYAASVWTCGEFIGKTMDMTHNLRLNFTSCGSDPGKIGEKSQEKVDIDITPKRDFMFQY
jgi:hypothetical protein